MRQFTRPEKVANHGRCCGRQAVLILVAAALVYCNSDANGPTDSRVTEPSLRFDVRGDAPTSRERSINDRSKVGDLNFQTLELGSNCGLPPAPWATGLTSLSTDWYAVPSPVQCLIENIASGSFDLKCEGKSLKIKNTLSSLPFSTGQTVAVVHCNPPSVFLANTFETIVVRDSKGVLLLAGGGSGSTLDASCKPSEIRITRLSSTCPSQPTGWYDECGPRANFPLEFKADTAAVLWQSQSTTLSVNGASYSIRNEYSFDAMGWKCTDVSNYYVAYSITRL